jgi:hypothetical protein
MLTKLFVVSAFAFVHFQLVAITSFCIFKNTILRQKSYTVSTFHNPGVISENSHSSQNVLYRLVKDSSIATTFERNYI